MQITSMPVNKEALDLVRKYLAEVAVQWKTGQATEHSYRPALKTLLEGLLKNVIVINEPQHIKCGAPDYILRDRRTSLHLGFIEAKDIGDGDLDGNGVHSEQFSRYRESLDSLCFTDYLDFHFYEGGEFRNKVRIAEVCGDRIVPAPQPVIEAFLGMVGHFGSAKAQKITSASRLAKLMAGKARLLSQAIREFLLQDTEKESMLAGQMEAFRNVLIHDITEESFADVYAQTITYGMFAARLHDETPEDFTRAEAASLIPKTNPLLRQMFNYIASDTNDTVEWIVDDLITLFAATDLREIMKDYGRSTEQTDPILHFYEDFLAAYNPALRKARGVWYTPQPVVGFIVRSVDRILETEFNLQGGLANNSKAKFKVANDNRNRKSDKAFVEREMHRVQILDPATGTGTFLAETVRLIHSKLAGMQGMWQNYVSEHLLPRLNGFEILMASYAMAHLKIDMLLAETGYRHESSERLRVFLTNSLEEHDKEIGTLFAAALSKEANEANYIKRDCPVMVVIGNPPYSISSSNKGEWIEKLVSDYKQGLNEKNIQSLSDDYIKFIRLGQYYIDRQPIGVLAYISNNSFIDGIVHRGMRRSLLESFDDVYVLNLHGSVKRKEKAEDGGKDENVFDIQQGVSINIFVKSGKRLPSEHRVHYFSILGSRKKKYELLLANSIETIDWTDVDTSGAQCSYVPHDTENMLEYDSGFKIDELFGVCVNGIKTQRDDASIAFTDNDCASLKSDFISLTESQLADKYGFKNVRDWTIGMAKKDIATNAILANRLTYRPFDDRAMLYTGTTKGIMGYPRYSIMCHMLHENMALVLGRQGQAIGNVDWCLVFVTQYISDTNIYYRGGGVVFPTYLYNDNMGQVEKTANLDKEIWAKINAAVGFETMPEDVFNYIYAVLHTPEYRERYKEFLKVDFPRIPYPKNGDVFRKLADIGRQIVSVHLLKDSATGNMFDPRAQFPVAGSNRVDVLKYEGGKVKINGEQHFDNVPEAAWNFYIGGYQPAQKWLKDRKGRTLNADDIMHYKAIVIALMETARLMADLSAIQKVTPLWP